MMHRFQISFNRLDEERRKALASCPDFMAFVGRVEVLGMELLQDMAPEVQSLSIHSIWLDPTSNTFDVAVQLHVLLSGMHRLECLDLEGPLRPQLLQQLPALSHLTSLTLAAPYSNKTIQELCRTLSLSCLNLLGRNNVDSDEEEEGAEGGEEDDFDFQAMLATLAAGNMAGLRELALPLHGAEARHLSRLSPLTALTNLELEMGDTSLADMGGLESLTGLKSLQVLFYSYPGDPQPVAESMSPLATLTRLTYLDLRIRDLYEEEDGEKECRLPSDVSAISSLAALRVLRCSYIHAAETLDGDPLPVQLRFLSSATGLEELELGFWGSFWSLPLASRDAMQEAVASVTSLKRVIISIEGRGLQNYCVPLRVFAAASSIECLTISYLGPRPSPSSRFRSAQARGCFGALSNLQSLVLYQGLHFADLLSGLPSTCLTRLELDAHAAPVPRMRKLMQEISRFSHLEFLNLRSFDATCLDSLDQLSDLQCLNWLSLVSATAYEPGARGSGDCCNAQAVALETAILERARRAGVEASVSIIGFGD